MGELYGFSSPGLWVNHKLDPEPTKDVLYMHAHDMLEIYFLLSGDVAFSIEGNEYDPEPDDILIVRSAETHKISTNPGKPYERITIHIAPSYLSRYCPEYKELLAPFFQRPLGRYNRYSKSMFPNNHWKECLLAMVSGAGKGDLERLYMDFNLLAFLAELNLAYTRRDLSEEKLQVNELSTQLFGYINDHLFEPISVLSISAYFHISPTHLNRVFRKAAGSSVWQYILTKRLLAAREQICAGTPAFTASTACGFGDYSAFYRAYKSMFGTSPQEDCRKAKN